MIFSSRNRPFQRFTKQPHLFPRRWHIYIFIIVIICVSKVSSEAESEDAENERFIELFDLNENPTINKTYVFTNSYHWESLHHQLTTIITFLALAKNISAIPVLPTMHSLSSTGTNNVSLVGDLLDIEKMRAMQPMLTLHDFLISDDYNHLKKTKVSETPFPKESQEEFEMQLKVYGRIAETRMKLPMPAEDPEGLRVYCHQFPATRFISADNSTRFIFFDHIHFLHFCTEKHMPWWYDIRFKIEPRKEFHYIARSFLNNRKRPMSIIHINDIMDISRERPEADIELYAQQIVSSLRKYHATSGSLYLMYRKGGKNTERVANLLRGEFDHVYSYADLSLRASEIANNPTDSSSEHVRTVIHMDYAPQILQWALSSNVELFVGNIHSPFSRNVCLFRKTHGKPYSTIRGFGELKRIWAWKL